MTPITYTLPENLLQAAVQLLGAMPAAQSRHVLNAIEAECSRQDTERAEKAKAEMIAEATRARDES